MREEKGGERVTKGRGEKGGAVARKGTEVRALPAFRQASRRSFAAAVDRPRWLRRSVLHAMGIYALPEKPALSP